MPAKLPSTGQKTLLSPADHRAEQSGYAGNRLARVGLRRDEDVGFVQRDAGNADVANRGRARVHAGHADCPLSMVAVR